jgi:hypothetical protein
MGMKMRIDLVIAEKKERCICIGAVYFGQISKGKKRKTLYFFFFFAPWAYYTVFSGAGVVSGTLHPAV